MARFSILTFLRKQWTTLPIPNADISDKSIVITGSNVGLGFEAAVHLAKLKPKRLLLTARDEAKGKQAQHDVQRRSMIKDVEVWSIGLGSFDSIRRFADRFELEANPINAFIANAAVATPTYAKTEDGWETTLQVNYLSTALLSILMLPHLIKSATSNDASRLVIVSSEAHFLAHELKGVTNWSSILRKLNDEEYCTTSVMMNRYELSKLLEVMFVRELASRLPNPTPVSVSAINPGLVMRAIKALLARTTEMGSRALVHPAVEPGERDRHERYVSSCEVAEESDYVLSEEGKEIARRLWTETVEILREVDPRVDQIIAEHLFAC